MKSRYIILLRILGALLLLSGGIWFLQGVNILPGSFMTGDPQWAVNGAIVMAIGIGFFIIASRRK